MKKIIIDKNKCIGCFKCKSVCPSVFEVGSDGLSKVRDSRETITEEAETAEICCPTGAISIEEERCNQKSVSLLDTFLSVLNDDVNDEEEIENDY